MRSKSTEVLGPVVETARPPKRRPAIPAAIGRLMRMWRARRIHGELKMLGITDSERTVSRILRALRRPPSQTWKTFLDNHLSQIVAIDFFTVPTVTMKVLFVFIVLAHRRCEVLLFKLDRAPDVGVDFRADRRGSLMVTRPDT